MGRAIGLRLRRNWKILVLAALTAVPLFTVRFLPVFDYPHWVYQAHVLTHYAHYREWYHISWAPTPNLGSTVALLLLTPLFGAELGAKLLLALYAFAMVVAFAYLVRGTARSSSALELLGPILPYSTFL